MNTLLAPKKIMVVEDESIISLDFRNSLKNLGYAVSGAATSGDVALTKVANNIPDLILMDIHLKGDMSGIEVSEQITSNYRIPVVYLTANADSATFRKANQTNPYGYILKPFNEKELGIAIEIALNKHQQEQVIHSSERWYATAFQSINNGVVGTDLVGNIVFMNAAAESMTGWAMSDVIDRPLVETLAFHRKIRQFDNIALRHSVSSILTAALRGNDAVPFPHCAQLLTKSLKSISVEGDATALRDSTGQIIGSIFVFRKSLFEPAIDDQAEAAEPLSRVSVSSLTSRENVSVTYQQNYFNHTSVDETVSKELGQTNHTSTSQASQKEKKYLAEDTAIVADFTRAFIAGKSVALSSPNLIASSNSGVTMLSSRAEGIIVRIATIGDELTAIVKQSSTYQPLIRHILIENSFFPISRRTSGHCHYQRRDIPEQCQIYHTGGAELWTAWHGRTTIEPVGGGVSTVKLSRSNIIVLRRGHWHRIQKMMMKTTGLHIKTIGGEIFVPPDDSLIWGIQGWPFLPQDSET